MDARIEVEAGDGYTSALEDGLSGLLQLMVQENVSLPPIRTLRMDPATVSIVVAIIGSVGPVLVKEIFKTVRLVLANHHEGNPTAHIKVNGKTHVVTADDRDDTAGSDR